MAVLRGAGGFIATAVIARLGLLVRVLGWALGPSWAFPSNPDSPLLEISWSLKIYSTLTATTMSLLGPVRPPFPLDICISNYYGIIVSPGTYNYHPSAELHCAVILANLRTTLPDLTRRIHCFWMGKYDQVSAHHPRLRGSPAGLVGLAKWVQRGFRLARELDRFLGRCPELLGGGEFFFVGFFLLVFFVVYLVLFFGFVL